ncbi:MAG: DUF4157 domain-containing protein [Rhodocyclaceae bacterium]|nr:DUF4157 domain-containing protein [Rhodocyclaceae bacterium]
MAAQSVRRDNSIRESAAESADASRQRGVKAAGAPVDSALFAGGNMALQYALHEPSPQRTKADPLVPVQPKLRVSQPGDSYEWDADRLAEQVMRKSADCQPLPVTALRSGVTRSYAHSDEDENSTARVQLKPGPRGEAAPAHVTRSALASATVGGRELNHQVRGFFEPRFGHNLSRVRIHTGNVSNQLAQRLNARAFTHGSDIVFGSGQYQPGTSEGKRLLAHELAHVLQQSNGQGGELVARQPVCSLDDVTESDVGSGEYYSVPEPELLECKPEDGEEQGQAGAQDFSAIDVSALSDYELLLHYRSNRAWLNNNPVVLLEWGDRSEYQLRLEQEIHCRPAVAAVAGAPADSGEQDLDSRVAAFKTLVKITAKHRLRGNIRSLEMWRRLVESKITAKALRVAGFSQMGSMRAYRELQEERNPMVREIRAGQAYGRFRACSGCHLEVRAREEAQPRPRWGREWLSPNEQRVGIEPEFPFVDMPNLLGPSSSHTPSSTSPPMLPPDWLAPATGTADATGSAGATAHPGMYTPPPNTYEAQLNAEFPDPGEMESMAAAVQPLLDQLGDGGYQVIPNDLFAHTDTPAEIAALRQQILGLIDVRRQGFKQLIRKIDAGDVEYHHFAPIIRDFLPLQLADVRQAIQDEMDSEARRALAEAIVVGIFSVIALIAVFFPPTTALGLATLGAIEVGLAAHALYRGAQMMDTGETYRLGTGADDVFSESQQASSGRLAASGLLSILGGLAFGLSGTTRLVGAVPRLKEAGAATASTALALSSGAELASGAEQAVQSGRFVISLEANGRMAATVVDHPDLLIIVEDGIATLYQHTGTGLRVLESTPLVVESPAGLLTAGEAATEASGAGVGPLALGEGASPIALLPEYAASRMAANWSRLQGLIGEPAATAELPTGYSRYQNAAGRWVIRRAVADDALFQRLFVDAEGLIQLRTSSTRASSTGFMNDALRLVSNPDHPLHFLMTRGVGPEGEVVYSWNTITRVTKSGNVQVGRYAGAEHAPVIQAGHQSAFASGEAQALMLEDAGINIADGRVFESRGAFSFKSAVDIQGVRVDVATAQMWERLGLLNIEGGVASLPRIPAPGAP